MEAKYSVDEPPERPELHASRQKLKDVCDPDYWRQLCPQLHVADPGVLGQIGPIQLPEDRLQDLSQQVNQAGVAQVTY